MHQLGSGNQTSLPCARELGARNPLGAPPMRVGLAILLALTLLGLPSAAAVGQRLANTFGPRYSPELVLPEQRVLFGRPALERPRECGARPILIAAGTLGGALGGYIGYQILWGIWPGTPRGFWGRPFRTTLVVGSAAFGAIGSAIHLSRICGR